MFIALRDLRFARGRFALISAVIGLMTLMVVLLTGLTAGLSSASVSAVAALPTTDISLAPPTAGQTLAFATSSLPADTAARVAAVPGVRVAHPVGISTTRLQSADTAAAATVIGTVPDLFPTLLAGSAPGAGQIAPTSTLAEDADLQVGDTVTVAGQQVVVSGIVTDTSFSHLPVLYTDIGTWQQIAHVDTITAVAVDPGTADTTAIDLSAGTTTVARDAAFDAVGGFTSEQSSLNLMRWLLVGISVLVVGSFFTVWTMQRAHDLAVVRAIGGTRGYLLRDALGQAAFVLLIGAGLGALVATGLGALAATVVPFILEPATVALPLLIMIAGGLLGAAVAVRTVSRVDPLTALGASR
jgi:putative ABC transport system permease protein